MAREFKDSGIEWIGQIPKEWEVCQLKRLLSFQNGQDYKHVESESGFPVYGSGGVFRCASQFLYDGEAVLFGRKGTVDRPLYVNEKFWTVDTMYYAIPLEKNIGKYIYYLSTQLPFDKYQTSTALPSMTQTILGSLCVVIPNISTQQKIADYLDKVCGEVDEMVALQEKMIEELKAYQQSVITEAVTKGLNPNVQMKDSGIDWIGEIPEHWNQAKTLYVLSMPITDGPHTTPDLYDEGIPFISADAVSDGYINFDNKRGYVSESFYEECCKKYIPQRDDIYMIKSGASTGRTAIVETDEIFTIWSPLAVFRANKSIMEPRFLLYVLRSEGYQKQVEINWSFGTQQNIGMRTLESLIVCYPSLSEQQQIASFLDTKCSEIDSLIALKQQKIEELKEYKKSIIYEYVTGKKEVA